MKGSNLVEGSIFFNGIVIRNDIKKNKKFLYIYLK